MRKRSEGSQRGQATTEYILMLALVVAVFLVSMRGVLFPAIARLYTSIGERIDDGFKSDLHRLPWGSNRR